MPWTPPKDELEYYSIPSPADSLYSLPQLLAPVLSAPSDPTYGRAQLPLSPLEIALRKEFKVTDGKIFPTGSEKEWVTYQVWYPKEEVESKHADLLFIHGINDYGGKFATHARQFLAAGYRIIVPDLPSHGRSTGIHVYVPDMSKLADALYGVLSDVLLQDSKLVKKEDGSVSQRRKVFVAGQSLGGFCAALTCLKYGSPETTDLDVEEQFRPQISGGIFLCPMLEISAGSRPPYVIELVAKTISRFAGSLPLAAANKGKNSEDPEVEEQFLMDPQTYHGKLRVGTGLAILDAITSINAIMPSLKIPFLLCHGTGDRVTSYHGSEKLYKEAMSTDKEIKLYADYQHILLRKGRDEQDDFRRQTVLNDMLDWLNRH